MQSYKLSENPENRLKKSGGIVGTYERVQYSLKFKERNDVNEIITRRCYILQFIILM